MICHVLLDIALLAILLSINTGFEGDQRVLLPYQAREFAMRKVQTLHVWGRGVRNAAVLKDMHNGTYQNGSSVEWYVMDGGGNEDRRDERPWKKMRHDEGLILTDALTVADWKDEHLEIVPMPHQWRSSRQDDRTDIYTVDLVECSQTNPNPKSQNKRFIRALVVCPAEAEPGA